MRLIFAGTPEPAVVALEKLIESSHEVIAVITRPDARRGRGRTLYPSPVKELAQRHGIEVLTPTTLKPGTEDGDALRARLAELRPDAIPVVAYGNLVTRDLLDVPTHGWVNLHFSLLPTWRGAAPVQAAIAHGDAVTGASTFRIGEGLDTGPVFSTIEEPISGTDTADDLLTRLAYAGGDLLVETMDGLEAGTATATPQQGEPTHAAKITTDDARIDWTQPAEVVDRQIRAVTPGPGAWTLMGDDRLKLGRVILSDAVTAEPGEVVVRKKAIYVGTGSLPVELTTVQAPGKKAMEATAWARGVHALNADEPVVLR